MNVGNENTSLAFYFSGYFICRVVVSERGGCANDHPQTRLRVGREIIEMSDDDEISIASEDVEEDEAAAEGGEENSLNTW